MVDEYEKDEEQKREREGCYRWISVGCKTEKWCGTVLQVFRYTGY